MMPLESSVSDATIWGFTYSHLLGKAMANKTFMVLASLKIITYINTCGLYDKNITIVNDASGVISE
jgi:hypothetical protein